jgi:hypothetical protein
MWRNKPILNVFLAPGGMGPVQADRAKHAKRVVSCR